LLCLWLFLLPMTGRWSDLFETHRAVTAPGASSRHFSHAAGQLEPCWLPQ